MDNSRLPGGGDNTRKKGKVDEVGERGREKGGQQTKEPERQAIRA